MINWEYLASLDFSVAWTYRNALLRGLGISLAYTGLAAFLGLALAMLTAAAVRSRFRLLRWPAIGFVELFRNTPLLVQLVWVHFALPQLTGVNLSILESGLLAITLNVTAYFSEILRAGIDAIPKGQWEAAHSLGLHPWRIWRHVILPQAIRIVFPPLASMIISLFKGTSVLSILAISELMRIVTNIGTHTARPVEIFTIGAILYFCCGALMTRGFDMLERRLQLRSG
jgi:polar amino acid transport system permease protein